MFGFVRLLVRVTVVMAVVVVFLLGGLVHHALALSEARVVFQGGCFPRPDRSAGQPDARSTRSMSVMVWSALQGS